VTRGDGRSYLDAAVLLAARALAAGAAGAIAAIAALTVAAVVMRYVLGTPFRFSEELCGLLLAMSAFLAMPLTVAADLNIRVTVLTDRLAPAAQRVAFLVGQAVLVAFGLVFLVEAWRLAEFTVMLGLRSEQARLPLGPWMIAMTAAVALTTVLAVWRSLRPPSAAG